MERSHAFRALAFAENFALKELVAHFPEAHRGRSQVAYDAPGGGKVFLYRFGAIVFFDVSSDDRAAELARLKRLPLPIDEAQAIEESFAVREEENARIAMHAGELVVDVLTPDRAGLVALSVAQSAAMEYYERIVDQMFADTERFAARLERSGKVPAYTRDLHRFIGAAIGTRSEVLSVLHLLDKPDLVWDDPGGERIFEELRSEFDLADRYQALELKLRSVQDALSLVTDVARDRRLVLLEGAVVLLIVLEIVLGLVHQ